ncbi:hypothetical protein LTR66_015699 [Elasticomyces elasticus]|nr:hypothetical protein LTR66_015699 [Elasticomyces elasticus]
MKGLGVVALFLPVVVRHASAQTGNQTNYFINPQQADAVDWYADNNAYAIGSSIQLQWKTNYTGISVTLWQVDSPHCSYITPPGVFVRQTLAWPVSPDKFDIYNANLTSPNVFYFTVSPSWSTRNPLPGSECLRPFDRSPTQATRPTPL